MTPTTAPYKLIFASKVNETPVFNTARERIGHIEDIAIGKLDGKVAYAILSVGGFLRIGEKYHPLPWSILTYDTALNGFMITLTKEALEKAPSYSKEELADIGDIDERYRQGIYDYYGPFGATPYWT
jgi:hypothetical protein